MERISYEDGNVSKTLHKSDETGPHSVVARFELVG